MKPVAIFRHARVEGAGYLGTFLEQHHIPWCIYRIDQNDPLPLSANEFSGLVLMGGPMSVNDDLPWIPSLLGLIRDAVTNDIPVIGHCLGAQLISKAMGGVVTVNPIKEIGWVDVQVKENPEAKKWFQNVDSFLAFHWHGETFSLPTNATHLLASKYCENQAFAIGKHLGLQCHIEMTEDMVKTWCEIGAQEIQDSLQSPGVQAIPDIQNELSRRVSGLNQVAQQVYTQWIKGLKA